VEAGVGWGGDEDDPDELVLYLGWAGRWVVVGCGTH